MDEVSAGESCAPRRTAKLRTTIVVDKQIAEADETKFRDNSDNKDVPLRLLICVLADPREKRDVGLLGEMIGQAKKYHLDRGAN